MDHNDLSRATISPIFKLLLVGFVLIVFHPFISRTTPVEIMYDAKRLFACFVLALSCLYFSVNLNVRNQFSQSVLMIDRTTRCLATLFFLWALWIAVSHAEFRLIGLYELCYLWALIIFGFIVATKIHITQLNSFTKLLNLLLFVNVALFFWILIANGYSPKSNLMFTFMNPRFLNQVQIWLFVPLAAFAFIEAKRKPHLWWSRASLIIAFATLYTTDARGAFIAASGGMILLALLDKHNRTIWLKLWLYSALVGYAAKFIFLDPLPTLLLGEQAEFLQPRLTDSGRIELWLEALKLATWSGQGSGFFVCHSTKFGHPHNSVLSVLVQWGVIGAICYISLILKVLLDTISTPSRLHRVLGVSLLTGVAYSLVSGVFVTPISQMFGAVTLGFYWISYLRHRPKALRKSNSAIIRKASIVLSAVAVISAVSISHRVYERATHYPESIEPSKAKVQFWVGENCN